MSNKLTLDEWALKNGFMKYGDGFVNSQQKFFARWHLNQTYKEEYLEL